MAIGPTFGPINHEEYLRRQNLGVHRASNYPQLYDLENEDKVERDRLFLRKANNYDRQPIHVTNKEYVATGRMRRPEEVTETQDAYESYGLDNGSREVKWIIDPAPEEPNEFTKFLARMRRTPVNARLNRNTPIVTRGGHAGVKLAQSQFFHKILAIFSDTPFQKSGSLFDSPLALKASGFGRAGGGFIGGCTAIYTMVEQGIEISNEIYKGRWAEGFDAALLFTEAMGTLGDSISVSASGLVSIGAVTAQAVMWASPLALASAFISLVTIPYHMHGIKQSEKILGGLQTSLAKLTEWKEEASLSDQTTRKSNALKWLSDALSDPIKGDGAYYLRRHFGIINREKYAAIVKYICANGETEKGQKTQKEMIGCLQNRLSDRIKSHRLAIVSAMIGIIGVCVFFFAPPLIFLGLGIIGLAGLVSFVRFVYDKRSVNNLEDSLDRLCHFANIPTEWLEENAGFAMDVRRYAKSQAQAIEMHNFRPQQPTEQEFDYSEIDTTFPD